VIETIAGILGLTTTGLKAAEQGTELIKKLKGAEPDSADQRDIILSLQEQLLTYRENQVELRARLVSLQEELATKQKSQDRFDMYGHYEFTTGDTVLRMKEGFEPHMGPRFACPVCAAKEGQLIALKRVHYGYRCPSCASEFDVGSSGGAGAAYSENDGW